MSAAQSRIVDLDATIARGEWWMRLFDELSSLGVERSRELAGQGEAPSRGAIAAFCRVARAVRMAIVAAMRLDQILSVLAALRLRSASDIAAARARARARIDEDAAREQAREEAREQARARREARTAELHEAVIDRVDRLERETPEPRDRDPLVEALDKRLAAVDPAIVDFDDLKLRETVLRICADLGVTPDWTRWEAGDWLSEDAPPAGADCTQPVPAPPKVLTPPVRQGLPGPTARRGETAPSHKRQPGPAASPWRPPRPG